MIDLYSVPTANGQKVHIVLEECGLEYRPHFVDLMGGEHLSEDFQKLNPGGRAPVIVDHDGPNGATVTLCETAAILFYLAEKTGRFMPEDIGLRGEVVQWLSNVSSNIGPPFSYQFRASVIDKEMGEHSLAVFIADAHRFLKAMDQSLDGRTYLVGETYTIADMQAYPVAATSAMRIEGGIEPYANIQKWAARIADRDAVKRGMSVLVQDAA